MTDDSCIFCHEIFGFGIANTSGCSWGLLLLLQGVLGNGTSLRIAL
jgi:hypothetical protein